MTWWGPLLIDWKLIEELFEKYIDKFYPGFCAKTLN